MLLGTNIFFLRNWFQYHLVTWRVWKLHFQEWNPIFVLRHRLHYHITKKQPFEEYILQEEWEPINYSRCVIDSTIVSPSDRFENYILRQGGPIFFFLQWFHYHISPTETFEEYILQEWDPVILSTELIPLPYLSNWHVLSIVCYQSTICINSTEPKYLFEQSVLNRLKNARCCYIAWRQGQVKTIEDRDDC